MVEVFKTNIDDRDQAKNLIDRIHKRFVGYEANFDLEDCDRILRVACLTGAVQDAGLIDLVKESGYHAEILPD
jgi:hypothetical protein